MTEAENVKVAVRVRPFNKREKDRKAVNVIAMNDKITSITNPDDKEDVKSFTYDYSYWSHDGSREKGGYFEPDPNHPNASKYCDQKQIYNDLGKEILKNAWNGYNSTLFAYGQTGSGKSWSVIGYGINKGIVPLLCEELFSCIKANKEPKQFEVNFSMLEIYNEVVRDLLSSAQKKTGLKIRMHPKKGFYVEGLNKVLVNSHAEIMNKMEQGTVQRTIQSTNMNATSSRAHTIVGITCIQKFKNDSGQETAKSAIINLVDLAGSERVESTGATGARLKEGAAINLSLTMLGNCIHALVKQSRGEPVRIPYRSSSLTKLLQNALGGNSKTVMIAAVSPADINYNETLSTLHFANRAKEIKTKAVVNEDPTEKLIRELRIENETLMKQLKTGKINVDFIDLDGDGIDDRDAAKLKKKWEEEMNAHMNEINDEMTNMKKSYEERLKMAQNSNSGESSVIQNEKDRSTEVHITNLNMDPQLSNKIFHVLKGGIKTVGTGKGKEVDITIAGLGIQPLHAIFTKDKKNIAIKPGCNDCRVLINGSPIIEKTSLSHNDRLVFGRTQFWVFQNPLDKHKQKTPQITYEYAQEEIAAKNGLDVNKLSNEPAEMAELQEELMEVMQAIEEANGISAELDRKAKFEIELISPKLLGQEGGKPQIQVKVTNLVTGNEYHWPKGKFIDRLYNMKEMYNNYEDDDYETNEDPFLESPDTELLLGTVRAFLQPVAHKVELKEQLEICNVKGQNVGLLNVEIVPCNSNGREYSDKDDAFVDNPEDLIGQDFHFVVKIQNGKGISNKYKDVYCAYTLYLDKQEIKSEKVSDTSNPNFKHKKRFSFKKVTKQFLDYLNTESLVIEVRGKHKAVRGSAIPVNLKQLSTKDMLKQDKTVFAKTANLMSGFEMNGRVVDPQRQSIIVELLLMKKTQAKLQQRVDNVVKLIKEAENVSRLRVSTTLLREVMNATTPDQADSIIRKKLAGNT